MVDSSDEEPDQRVRGEQDGSETSETSLSSFDDSGPEVSGSEDGDDSSVSDVDVDFEFFDPKEGDFHSLKALLNNYLDGETYQCSELVDLILSQGAVGTVVKTGEDEDPIGFVTVLNLQRHADKECLQQIKAFLLDNCNSDATKAKLTKAWGLPNTGLLLSERVINSPPELAPPLQSFLFDEIQAASEDQELQQEFAFQRYLLLCRAYLDTAPEEEAPAGQGPDEQQPKKKRKKVAAKASTRPPELVFPQPECHFYHANAHWSFQFPVANRGEADGLTPVRVALLIDAKHVEQARKQLDAAIGNQAADELDAELA